MHSPRWARGVAAAACVLSTAALAGCGGGEKNGAASGAGDTTAMAATPTPAGSTAAAGAGTGATPAAGGGAITGQTVDVKMVLDGANYRFDPASITIHPGDGVRWTMVSGGPHNVSFWADSIPSGAQSVLQANMPNQMTPLVGPLLMNPNETYTVSFAGAPTGVYKYYCTPHLAMGMKAQVTVQ